MTLLNGFFTLWSNPREKVENLQISDPPTKKWDKSGVVDEKKDHDQYWIKIDGSGRLTLRNRRFLRAFTAPIFDAPIPGPAPVSTPQQPATAACPRTSSMPKPQPSNAAYPQPFTMAHHQLPAPLCSYPLASTTSTSPPRPSATPLTAPSTGPASATLRSSLLASMQPRPSTTLLTLPSMGPDSASLREPVTDMTDPAPPRTWAQLVDSAPPISADAAPPPLVSASPSLGGRPKRDRHPRLRFVPETGKWE